MTNRRFAYPTCSLSLSTPFPPLLSRLSFSASPFPQAALKRLDEEQHILLDRNAMHEMRARLLLKLDRKEDASKEYAILVDDNAENLEHLQNYAATLGLTERCDTRKRMPGSASARRRAACANRPRPCACPPLLPAQLARGRPPGLLPEDGGRVPQEQRCEADGHLACVW